MSLAGHGGGVGHGSGHGTTTVLLMVAVELAGEQSCAITAYCQLPLTGGRSSNVYVAAPVAGWFDSVYQSPPELGRRWMM
jgi:hypothetical protein